MTENFNVNEQGPRLPEKADLERLANIFTDSVIEKGIGSLDTANALKDWIDTKQVHLENDKEGHPDILKTVRFNLALGNMYFERGFYDDAEQAISDAWGILQNIKIHYTDESFAVAFDDYEHDIGYLFNLIDSKREDK